MTTVDETTAPAPVPDLPLAGLTVVELATSTGCALAARMMAGYGADVIKVEGPEGDPSRAAGPFPPGRRGDREVSAAFLYLHGGKRSVVAGEEQVEALLAGADILLTDQPGRRPASERLITISVTPYGGSGPHSAYRATALTEYAAGGQMSLMGDPDRPPLKAYGDQAGSQAAFHAFGAAMAALLLRGRTGRGSRVELSVQELEAGAMEAQGPMAYNHDDVPPALGRRSGNGMRAYWSQYACRDGWVGIFVNPPNIPAFLAAIERPDLAERVYDDAFAQGELYEIVAAWCAGRTREEVYADAIRYGAPFSYVATPDDLLTSPTVAATGIWRDVEHPEAGRFRVPGPPFRSDGFAFELTRAPLLGEHTP